MEHAQRFESSHSLPARARARAECDEKKRDAALLKRRFERLVPRPTRRPRICRRRPRSRTRSRDRRPPRATAGRAAPAIGPDLSSPSLSRHIAATCIDLRSLSPSPCPKPELSLSLTLSLSPPSLSFSCHTAATGLDLISLSPSLSLWRFVSPHTQRERVSRHHRQRGPSPKSSCDPVRRHATMLDQSNLVDR